MVNPGSMFRRLEGRKGERRPIKTHHGLFDFASGRQHCRHGLYDNVQNCEHDCRFSNSNLMWDLHSHKVVEVGCISGQRWRTLWDVWLGCSLDQPQITLRNSSGLINLQIYIQTKENTRSPTEARSILWCQMFYGKTIKTCVATVVVSPKGKMYICGMCWCFKHITLLSRGILL